MILDFILNVFFFDQFNQSLEVYKQEKAISNYGQRILTAHAFSNSLPISENRLEPIAISPIKKDLLSLGVDISAENALLLDKKTKAVLWGKDARVKKPIASITKLLTALVVLDENPTLEGTAILPLEDYIPFGRLIIRSGETYQIKDLFHVLLIGSDNNSATLLMQSTGLSLEEFSEKMNAKAKELGMLDSSFVEPTGLSAQNISTAFDVSLLLAHIENHEGIKGITSLGEYRFSPVNANFSLLAPTTNKLIDSFLNRAPYKITAGKTGYIEESGYCFSAVIESAEHNGGVIAVVLDSNAPDARFQDLKSLVSWGFDAHEWPK